MKSVFLLLLFWSAVPSAMAVVYENVEIKDVLNGHTILVSCSLSGTPCLMPVRLMYIRAPESAEDGEFVVKSRAMLDRWVNRSATYVLWSPELSWTHDEHGRLLAVAYESLAYNEKKENLVSLQDHVVAAGWGCPSEHYGKLPEHRGLAENLRISEEVARRQKWGFWSNPPAWTNSSNAPKK